MAASQLPPKESLQAKHVALIRKKIRDLPLVANYLLNHKVLNDYYMNEFSKKSERDQCGYLIDLVTRRGCTAFNTFVDALVDSRQFELAKDLKPSLNLNDKVSSVKNEDGGAGDGNCVSGSSRSESNEREGANEPFLIEPPSEKSIKENERFYYVEKDVYAGLPNTDGILTGLAVVKCSALPALFNPEECYVNSSKPKGLAIIFNNRRFDKPGKGLLTSSLPLPERLGTDIDCKNMERLLKELGYHVKVKMDLTAQDMLEAMLRFSLKSEHKTCHSAIVVVLTHGTCGKLYGTDGNLIQTEEFISFLNAYNCPALKNKPKLFIIQACRGDRYDEGVDGLTGPSGDSIGGATCVAGGDILARNAVLRRLAHLDEVDANSIAKTPTDADVLVAYATTPGYVSWRNTMRGSWFVQAICEIFARDAHKEEVLHLFTKVNRRVAEQLSGSGHKQVPEPSSRLTKKFYFFPGLYE